jgi:hypothetical protein
VGPLTPAMKTVPSAWSPSARRWRASFSTTLPQAACPVCHHAHNARHELTSTERSGGCVGRWHRALTHPVSRSVRSHTTRRVFSMSMLPHSGRHTPPRSDYRRPRQPASMNLGYSRAGASLLALATVGRGGAERRLRGESSSKSSWVQTGAYVVNAKTT